MLSGCVRLMPVATAGARPCGGLDHVDVEVVVGEHRAADRGDADRPSADAQLVDHLGDEPVGDAVAAARDSSASGNP